MGDVCFAVGFDKYTGQVKAVSHADKWLAYRIAAGYRKAGHRAKVFLDDVDYYAVLDRDYMEFGPGYRTTIS